MQARIIEKLPKKDEDRQKKENSQKRTKNDATEYKIIRDSN